MNIMPPFSPLLPSPAEVGKREGERERELLAGVPPEAEAVFVNIKWGAVPFTPRSKCRRPVLRRGGAHFHGAQPNDCRPPPARSSLPRSPKLVNPVNSSGWVPEEALSGCRAGPGPIKPRPLGCGDVVDESTLHNYLLTVNEGPVTLVGEVKSGP